MIDIQITDEVKQVLPDVRLGCIQASVNISPSRVVLLEYIRQIIDEKRNHLVVEEISKIDIIAETKDAYRKLGKDPSRYRPSAEALSRRIAQGKGLYRVNNIVDALNIISIGHGFSIGGYDIETIDGPITLGIGKSGEPYDAIGRGLLNIENLPVLRDNAGAFGSPTSDSSRTMVRDTTSSFLMVFFDFKRSSFLDEAIKDAEYVYKKFCDVDAVEVLFV